MLVMGLIPIFFCFLAHPTDHAGTQGPVLAGEVNEGERHGEEAQEKIGDGKVYYKDVSCSQ